MAMCEKHGEPLPGCPYCQEGTGHRHVRTTTPFALAEIVDPAATGAALSYTQGWNCSGTGEHEVIQVVRHPDGAACRYVIMRGLSSAKAAAIVLILNAPEG